MTSAAARTLVCRLLPDLPHRRDHTLAVGSKAEQLVDLVDLHDDRGCLVPAAYLHDIGYARDAVQTGLHQLDGARYLREIGAPPDVCVLVAHHSSAICEATERGLAAELLAEFPIHEGVGDLLPLLTYCDMTTSPTGTPTTLEKRLEDIYRRYGPDHLVTRAIAAAEPTIRLAVSTTYHRILDAGAAIA